MPALKTMQNNRAFRNVVKQKLSRVRKQKRDFERAISNKANQARGFESMTEARQDSVSSQAYYDDKSISPAKVRAKINRLEGMIPRAERMLKSIEQEEKNFERSKDAELRDLQKIATRMNVRMADFKEVMILRNVKIRTSKNILAKVPRDARKEIARLKKYLK